MTSAHDDDRSPARAKVHARRRVLFAFGMTALAALVAVAGMLGAGCIFDEGDYQGGGRRIGAPLDTSKDEEIPPVPTATSTATTPPADSGDPGPPDTGAPDA